MGSVMVMFSRGSERASGGMRSGQGEGRPGYSDSHSQPNFVPDQPYDKLGIFTGSMVERPAKPGDEHGLTIFYTSVPILPIHWTTPHPRGAEGVTLATSKEGYECGYYFF